MFPNTSNFSRSDLHTSLNSPKKTPDRQIISPRSFRQVEILGSKISRSMLEKSLNFRLIDPRDFEGPGFWGLINPDWWLCHKGRRQSPVNLEPSRLLFDPNLQPLHVDKHRVGGVLANTGHSVVFAVDNDTRHPVNISGGPLSYRYQFHEIHLHFGLDDRTGSEHTVDGHAFPAEVSAFLKFYPSNKAYKALLLWQDKIKSFSIHDYVVLFEIRFRGEKE